MDNAIPGFGDETGERLLETGKKTVKNVVKNATQAVKVQVVGDDKNQTQDSGSENQDKKQGSGNKKIDPVTGKPVISKKTLTQLNQQVAQLAQMRIKKVREELEKQRLKVSGQMSGSGDQSKSGPEVPIKSEKPKEDVISKVLKASKSTGEYGKNIGG